MTVVVTMRVVTMVVVAVLRDVVVRALLAQP